MEQSHGQGGGMHLACCSGRSSCGRFARRFAAVWVLCCVSEYDQNTTSPPTSPHLCCEKSNDGLRSAGLHFTMYA